MTPSESQERVRTADALGMRVNPTTADDVYEPYVKPKDVKDKWVQTENFDQGKVLYSTLTNSSPLYPTLPYSTLPYSTLLYSTLLYSTLLYSTLLYSTLLYSTLLYSTLLYSTLLYSTLLYSTLLYSTLLYSTLPYPTLPYPTLLYSTLLYFALPQPRPQAQPLPLRGYCVENTVGNARSGLAENAEKSV